MMQAKILVIMALALAACGNAGDAPTSRDGASDTPWPVLGSMSGTIGGAQHAWNAYDFSEGDFDASAAINGRILTLSFYPQGEPETKQGLLYIEAPLWEMTRTSAVAGAARVMIIDDAAWQEPRLRDLTGALQITAFEADTPLGTSGAGRIAGRITAQLCEATGGGCVPFAGTFETRLQITP